MLFQFERVVEDGSVDSVSTTYKNMFALNEPGYMRCFHKFIENAAGRDIRDGDWVEECKKNGTR